MSIQISNFKSADQLYDGLNRTLDGNNTKSVKLEYHSKSNSWSMRFSKSKPGLFDKLRTYFNKKWGYHLNHHVSLEQAKNLIQWNNPPDDEESPFVHTHLKVKEDLVANKSAKLQGLSIENFEKFEKVNSVVHFPCSPSIKKSLFYLPLSQTAAKSHLDNESQGSWILCDDRVEGKNRKMTLSISGQENIQLEHTSAGKWKIAGDDAAEGKSISQLLKDQGCTIKNQFKMSFTNTHIQKTAMKDLPFVHYESTWKCSSDKLNQEIMQSDGIAPPNSMKFMENSQAGSICSRLKDHECIFALVSSESSVGSESIVLLTKHGAIFCAEPSMMDGGKFKPGDITTILSNVPRNMDKYKQRVKLERDLKIVSYSEIEGRDGPPIKPFEPDTEAKVQQQVLPKAPRQEAENVSGDVVDLDAID